MVSLAGDIWIVSRDPHAVATVGDVLELEGASTPGVCRSLSELRAVMAEGANTTAAFVDIEPDPVGILTTLEAIVAQHPATRFIVLANQFSNDLVMEAMNVGARHFVAKSGIEHELPRILERLATSGAADANAARGAVVTLLSAGGGCGATTLSVNLARELADREGQAPALLIDFDDAYGAITSYLGLRGEFGLDAVCTDAQRIDPQLVRSTALRFSDQLHALINPVSIHPDRVTPIKPSHLGPVLASARRAYRWVVADAPRVGPELAATLARASQMTLIVGQLCVKDVRCARALHHGLVVRGIEQDAVACVFSRHRAKHGMLSVEEAKQALGDVNVHLIRNDYAAAIKSIDLGKPLAEVAPRSAARKDTRALAEQVRRARPVAMDRTTPTGTTTNGVRHVTHVG